MAKITWKQVPSMIGWNRLRNLREEKRLTQLQLAANAGISIAKLWMLEQGYDGKTTNQTKRKIVKFFGCDISDLFPTQMIGNITLEQYLKESQKD